MLSNISTRSECVVFSTGAICWCVCITGCSAEFSSPSHTRTHPTNEASWVIDVMPIIDCAKEMWPGAGSNKLRCSVWKRCHLAGLLFKESPLTPRTCLGSSHGKQPVSVVSENRARGVVQMREVEAPDARK